MERGLFPSGSAARDVHLTSETPSWRHLAWRVTESLGSVPRQVDTPAPPSQRGERGRVPGPRPRGRCRPTPEASVRLRERAGTRPRESWRSAP